MKSAVSPGSVALQCLLFSSPVSQQLAVSSPVQAVITRLAAASNSTVVRLVDNYHALTQNRTQTMLSRFQQRREHVSTVCRKYMVESHSPAKDKAL